MSHGVDEISRLRKRQIADGKTEAADQQYKAGELLHLAIDLLLIAIKHEGYGGDPSPEWVRKEGDRLANEKTVSELLAHAGACLAAEIDRRSHNPFACMRCGANIAPEYRYEGPGGEGGDGPKPIPAAVAFAIAAVFGKGGIGETLIHSDDELPGPQDAIRILGEELRRVRRQDIGARNERDENIRWRLEAEAKLAASRSEADALRRERDDTKAYADDLLKKWDAARAERDELAAKLAEAERERDEAKADAEGWKAVIERQERERPNAHGELMDYDSARLHLGAFGKGKEASVTWHVDGLIREVRRLREQLAALSSRPESGLPPLPGGHKAARRHWEYHAKILSGADCHGNAARLGLWMLDNWPSPPASPESPADLGTEGEGQFGPDHPDREVACGHVLGQFTRLLNTHGEGTATDCLRMAGMIPRLKRALLKRAGA